MAKTLVMNAIHIVFSTKNREPLICPSVENELHHYLGGICNALDCQSIKVGGWIDHVHILCMLSKKIALMNLLEPLKSNSSKWIKSVDPIYKDFAWQRGYGAFSVDYRGINNVRKYIANQHTHHQKESFQDEFRGILNDHEIEFDEQYIWL